jgi:hypothetical protein
LLFLRSRDKALRETEREALRGLPFCVGGKR